MGPGSQVGRGVRSPAARPGWRDHVGPVGLQVAVVGLLLRPALTHLTTRPLVGEGDSSIFVWAWWHLVRSLRQGSTPWRTDLLFHPVGVDLSVTVTAPLVGLLTWPVRALWGADAQVNVVQLGAGVGAALGAYALLLHVTGGHRWIAAVGGLVYAATPFRFVHLQEHLNLVHTGVVPVGLLLALRLAERPGPRRAAALGAWLGATVLVEPQLALITAFGVAALLARRWTGPRPGPATAGVGLAALAVAAAPVAVPLVLGLAGDAAGRTASLEALTTFSSRPLQWLLPPATHPWFGAWAGASWTWGPTEGVAAPGFVVLVLAVWGGSGRLASTERRGWVLAAGLGVVLSLGPFLTGGRAWAPVPLPFALLTVVPGLDSFRVPGRFALLGVLALVVLAAQAAPALLARAGRRAPVVAALLVALLAVELRPGPLTQRPGGTPAPYAAIAADARAHPPHGDGAVLDLPLQWSDGFDLVGHPVRNLSIFQAWATVHGRPIVHGSVSRYPPADLARLEAIDLYRQVRVLQGDADVRGPVDLDVQDLVDLGIGYVVYHRDVPAPAAFAHLVGLGMPVLADDGTVLVWRVPGA